MGLVFLIAAIASLAFLIDGDDSVDGTTTPDPQPPVTPDPEVVDPPEPISLEGGEGSDTLEGGELNDTLSGNGGPDNIAGLRGDDLLNGGVGFDILFGDEGDDTLFGGAGNDTAFGGADDDLILGEDGNDSLIGWTGSDTIFGGAGFDTLGGDAGQIGVGDPEHGDDSLDGGAGNDVIAGNGGLDTLIGGDGNDRIFDADLAFYDGPNASSVDGGAGDDVIYVDGGSTITGGTGADEIQIHANLSGEGVTQITDFDRNEDSLLLSVIIDQNQPGEVRVEDADNGTDAQVFYGDTLLIDLAGAAGLTLDDIAIRIELDGGETPSSVMGGDGDERFVADGAANTIDAGGGNDTISAGGPNGTGFAGGADVLLGGAGDDYISTTASEVQVFDFDDGGPLTAEVLVEVDTVNGGDGNDTLLSENGAQLTGGEGADIFGVFQELRYVDQGVTPPPTVITDFESGIDRVYVELLNQNNGGIDAEITVETASDGVTVNIFSDGVLIAQDLSGTVTLGDIDINNNVEGPFLNF